MIRKALIGALILVGVAYATRAAYADQAANTVASERSIENAEVYSDPLAPVNEKILIFNLDLDKYVLSPVARAYAAVLPEAAREHVGLFWENTEVIPRAVNAAVELRFVDAGGEVARFGINSTLGALGFFDVADSWFGLKQHDNDFGLALGHYGVPPGPYLMLPFYGPSNVRDLTGIAVDGAMDPLAWVTPWYVWLPVGTFRVVAPAVNYRSLHPDQFEQVDRYAIDLYGAVQDGYMQSRQGALRRLSQPQR